MKNRNNITTGQIGEEAASKFLTTLGYRIIERNYRKNYGEIDIIAIDGHVLVFIEVKTRKGNTYGLPEEAITPWKINHLIKSVKYYQLTHDKLGHDIRIDVVSISLTEDGKAEKIKLFKNITM